MPGLEMERKDVYVGDADWDDKWDEAVHLMRTPWYSVWLHDHGADDLCRADGSRCACGTLTYDEDGPRLDLIPRRMLTTE